MAQIIERKFKTPTQYDNTTQEGVLRRVYYYQKDRYDDVPSLKKFLKAWQKDKKFKEVWNNYKDMRFSDNFAPTFFRWGTDTKPEKLYVCHKGQAIYEKELLKGNDNG